jgi:hypothetical protein
MFSPMNPFSAAEYCDRLKHEFEFLHSQLSVTKLELERCKAEKEELSLQSKKV